jgi:hypothetical protein
MSAKIRRAGIDGNVLTAAGLFVLPRFLTMPGNVIFILFRYVTCQHTGSPRLRLGFHGQRSWEQRMMELGKCEMGKGKGAYTVVLWSLKKKKKRSKPTLAALDKALCCRPKQPSQSQERPRRDGDPR